MALDYYKVQPDKITLLGGHFTPGRRGAKIEYITRHHTAGVLDADAINRIWKPGSGRQASTHYLADPKGVISQHVWDKDTAWSNGNAYSNARAITIEHSNCAGADKDWPISEETIIAGARWAAAQCLFHELGRPEFGKNIRDHKEFYGTSCPYHLAKGGKYHQQWMDESQHFYDLLVAKKVTKNGQPITRKDKPMANQPLERLHQIAEEIRIQLMGPDRRGWNLDWLMEQAAKREKGYATVPEVMAVLKTQLDRIEAKLDERGR